MVYYRCSEVGCGGCNHDCSGVMFVNGVQVCSPYSLQWQIDYFGKPFCANLACKIDLYLDQFSMEI